MTDDTGVDPTSDQERPPQLQGRVQADGAVGLAGDQPDAHHALAHPLQVHGWLSWRRRMGTWHEVMDVMALCGQVARLDAVGRRTPFGYRDLVRFKEPTPQHYAWLRHRSGSGRS